MPACLLTLLLAAGAMSAEVSTLEGDFVSGEILSLDATGILLRDEDGAEREIPSESVLHVVAADQSAQAAGPITLELVDGTVLHVAGITTLDGQARAVLASGQVLEFPSRFLALVRFWPASAALEADWQEIIAQEFSGDLLVLRREADTLDYLDGLAGEITADAVGFTFEGSDYTADRGRVEGLRFSPPRDLDLAPLACVLEQLDGSRWQASHIELAGDAWRITTLAGIETTVPVSHTRLLDFSSDKLVYLSSLEPIRQSYTPFLERGFDLQDVRYEPRFDESLDGGPLQLLLLHDGKEQEMSFPRGLALHSRSELEFRLPEGFRRFQALAGIDERVRPHGHVKLEILGDGRPLFEGEIASLTAEGRPATAVPLDLDIEGVSRLTIRVDFGQGQDVGDHLDLANAQIRK